VRVRVSEVRVVGEVRSSGGFGISAPQGECTN
jgi:hypothetical protein